MGPPRSKAGLGRSGMGPVKSEVGPNKFGMTILWFGPSDRSLTLSGMERAEVFRLAWSRVYGLPKPRGDSYVSLSLSNIYKGGAIAPVAHIYRTLTLITPNGYRAQKSRTYRRLKMMMQPV